MAKAPIKRFYPLPSLNFRDFWDICTHYLRLHSKRDTVIYNIYSADKLLIKEETDVSLILQELARRSERVSLFEARVLSSDDFEEVIEDCPMLRFEHDLPDQTPGLRLESREMDKLALYQFEELLYAQYALESFIDNDAKITFGRPCEILAAVIDMRGFSNFCEKPNIESPYTSALMSSFYRIVQESFLRYPPEMIKYLGDGVLSIWETHYKDRDLAIRTCLQGLGDLNTRWQVIRKSPQFSHGAPADIGIGISFGLASLLTVDNDYIGRPINLASRLCSVCNGWEILVDKAIPSMPDGVQYDDYQANMKSFGRFNCWRVNVQ